MDDTPPLEQPLSRIMSTGALLTTGPEDSLESVLSIFREGQLSHLPVLNREGRLVGVISPSDILKVPWRSKGAVSFAAFTVADTMTKNVETLPPTATVEQAAKLFALGGFHSLLITASDGELLGIVTTSDIIKVLLQ